ncbi:MAG: MtrAB system histidine kinase MtrB [Micrococcales bacterium]|nr:MtrAB system histidine kinase MtrB [Micrococcales bacterium]
MGDLIRPFRRSLRLRVSLTVVVVSSVLLLVVGTVLTNSIRSGIFDTRMADILREADRAATTAQRYFDAGGAGSPLTAETVARDTIRSVSTVGSSAVAVSLLPQNPDEAGAVSAIFTDPQLWDVASDQLREQASTTGEQVWQSVALPQDFGGLAPGVAVAKSVRLAANGYVLVLVYDLSAEQTIMSLIARIVGIAAGSVVVILVLVTFLATRQAVRPVKDAAAVASRLADGALGERMRVRGQTEMASLAASFNAMAQSMQSHIEDMENLSKLQRRFVADVSHELRTPLATIRMAGDLLYQARGSFEPEVGRSAELLASQLDRFEALLSDLLEISRIDAGTDSVDLEQEDMAQLVRSAKDNLEPLAKNNDTEIRVELPGETVMAQVDRRRIERIITNLVANAILHSGSDTVDVRLAATDNEVFVKVQDHGVGLTTDQLGHVFERFWRADPARSRATTGGTGLGLPIAQENAKVHGGRLDVQSQSGQGTAFTLVLPRAFEPQNEASNAANALAESGRNS